MEIDPVCGMTVNPATAKWKTEHAGTTRYFCGERCLTKFRASPAQYLAPSGSSPEAVVPKRIAPRGSTYTCPMHPEIVRAEPGSCPICGMALEPIAITLEDAPNPELVDMTRRLWWSIAPAAIVFALGMSELLPGMPLQHAVSARTLQWIELALATPVVLWAGFPFFERGVASVVHRSLNMFTLIALGTGAAYAFSVVATVAPGLFPSSFRAHDGTIGVYFEAAAVITVLVLVGQVLELRARSQTGSAIRSLLGLAPKTARRIGAGGAEEDVPLEAIHRDDELRVRPGERVPCDGIVLEGSSLVDESMVTGEPMPVNKTAGEHVTGGTINGTGALRMKAERVGSETLLAQIVRLVSEAQRSRPAIARLADRVSSYFVPAVVTAAVVTFVAWAAWGPEPRLAHALVNAVAVLIIACPCALGLATPMSIMVGVGRAASMGVLFKDAQALETLRSVDTVVVDKTGTLTEGKPRVVAVVASPGFDEREILRLAASLERASEHPLGAAIVAKASADGIALGDARELHALPGRGIDGHVGERAVAVGNLGMMRELVAAKEMLAEYAAQAEAHRAQGRTVVFVAVDGTIAGLFGIADAIKATARAAIKRLHDDGLRVVMLTGDTRTNADAVARELAIDEVEAEVLPTDKGEVIRRLKREGHIVAMAGDGINDAPALAEAHVGIAMGTGTDVAMQSAGIVLVGGDLAGIARARAMSRATMSNIRQNLVLAFVYNLVGIPIAAGVLYPALGWLLSPMIASAAMSMSSVSVISNALRLRRARVG